MDKPIKSAMVSVAGTTLTEKEKSLFQQYSPLGVTLFKRNIETPNQVVSLVKEIKEVIGRDDVLIGIDQEGGRVARLTPPFFQSYLAQRSIGELPLKTAKEAAFLQAKLIWKNGVLLIMSAIGIFRHKILRITFSF